MTLVQGDGAAEGAGMRPVPVHRTSYLILLSPTEAVVYSHTRSDEVRRGHTGSDEVKRAHTWSDEVTRGQTRSHGVSRGHAGSDEVMGDHRDRRDHKGHRGSQVIEVYVATGRHGR